MAVWGKLSKCCCFPLAGGCTAAAIFHFIACLACIFTSEQNYKVWTVVSIGEAFFLNLYLSICKVFKAGGTGWEFKNYMEIENDMQKEKKKKEKEDAMKHNDYNA
ncbi:conserved Plasmodium membrane protein, unknown function [Plasmodium malariae]|uniref:Uncharacterized protein n=1 Tax=Plasmodium malariae TaxID=5858 RepID=A0A1A8VYF4_PLAMA|nr:conserved Plasmodium membrane protein, unknown function [Plasmodium malariae]